MKLTLGGKVTLAILCTTVLAMSAAIATSLVVLRDASDTATVEAQTQARNAIRSALEREGTALSQALADQAAAPMVELDFVKLRDLCVAFTNGGDVSRARVVGPDGLLLAYGTPAPALRQLASGLDAPVDETAAADAEGGLRVARRVRAGGEDLGFVVLDLDLGAAARAEESLAIAMAAHQQDGVEQLVWATAAAGFALLILAAIIAALLGRQLSRPIVTLKKAVARVGSGDLEVRVEVTSEDEFGALGRAFNEMIAEISVAREAATDQARMTKELEIAATIQTSLLPPEPVHPDFEFVGRMRAADEVGGDFYDVLTNGRSEDLWLTVGDVSSHGIGAGVVMLMTQASFSSLFRVDPTMAASEALQKVNYFLRENIAVRLKDNKYVTAQLFCYRGEGRFQIVGAHEWPIVVRSGANRAEMLPSEGPWLGVVDKLPSVPTAELVLELGDLLCLYSDGIIESMNAEGEQFDVDRLQDVLTRGLEEGLTLDAIADRVYEAVEAFAVSQDDDRSLLLARRRTEGGASRLSA